VGELVLRMVLSLCIVLGLLLLAARVAGKRYRSTTGSTVTVLQRQALSRGSTVTVVSVGSRVLVLGTTEQQVRVLAELDPTELALPEGAAAADPGAGPGRLYAVPPAASPAGPTPPADFAQVLLDAQDPAPAVAPRPTSAAGGRHRAAAPVATPSRATDGALSGSLLSPQTWRQALAALSGRAS
jgi:flagellar protein FliO/FliZ